MHVGMEPSKTSQTRWEHHHNTCIHTIPTSCAILLTMHNKNLPTYSLKGHSTHHCSLHSLPHKRQSISVAFSSNKISQHNLKLLTHHTDPALLTVSVYKTNYTCHAQQELHCIHPNITLSMHINMYCTPTNTLPTAFHNFLYIQLTNTKHSWQNVTRCGDGVDVLWCRSHLVWLVFEGSNPTCTCFHQENFFVTSYIDIVYIPTQNSVCL